ncbi:N-acetyltransferase ESCO2 [Chamaea fasciata]|uniref:N-acetyltransferase ESCO2 n=1 Tax=Chamaea fasciata TaxID=190680 RepID=UPI00336AC608
MNGIDGIPGIPGRGSGQFQEFPANLWERWNCRSCGEAAGTPRKRGRESPGWRSEFQTPESKRLRAAPGAADSRRNSRDSRDSPSSEEEQREKGIFPRRLEIAAGIPGIPRSSRLALGASGGSDPGISPDSQFPVGAFYGKRIYLDPLERRRLRELLGDGKVPGKTGNAGGRLGNSKGNCGNSGRNLGNSKGNSGRSLGNSKRNSRNSGRKSGSSSRNSGRNLGNSGKSLGNSGRNGGNAGKSSGNCGGNCGSKSQTHPRILQGIPGGKDSGNSGSEKFGNSGNSGNGNLGNSGNGNSGNSGNGNLGNSGNGNLGNPGNEKFGNSGNGNLGNSGNSGNGNLGNSGNEKFGNCENGNSGNGNFGNSGNPGNEKFGNSGNSGNPGNGNFGNSGNPGNENSGNSGNEKSGNPGNEKSGNAGTAGNENSGNSGNSGPAGPRVQFRVLSSGLRPPLRLRRGSSFFLSGKTGRKNSRKNPGEAGADGKNPREKAGKEKRECSKEEIPGKNPLEKSGKENRECSKEEIPGKNPLEKSGKENRECSKGQEEIPGKNPLEKSRKENWECSKEKIPGKNPLEKRECSKEEIPGKNPLEKSGKENRECSKEEIPGKNPLENSGQEEPAGSARSQDPPRPGKDPGSSRPAGLFPIFLPGRRRPLQELPAPFGPSGKTPRKSKEIQNSQDQLIIDAGQRALGAGQCAACGMLFAPGAAEDRLQHLRHHRRVRRRLAHRGWKQQRVVAEFWDGKIILILPHDPKYALSKAQEVLQVVDAELGFPASAAGSFPPNSRLYLFVGSGKCVLGCLVAEPIQQAFRVLPEPEPERAWRCGPRPEPAVCGLSRLWVLAARRRRRIARRMADCLRQTFVFGAVLSSEDLAFSDPTADGRAFAQRYCGRPDFLVYSPGNAAAGSASGSAGSASGSAGSAGAAP